MGSIDGSTAIKQTRRPFSHRQAQYLKSKRTGKKHVKREQQMQIELCDWMRATFPGVHFRSDTASGAFSSQHEKEIHNQQQSDRGLPDITIFAMQHGYGALCLELKADGETLKCKRDSSVLKVTKDRRGRIIERDYKIRKKGDWKNLHIERQANRIEELKRAGYMAGFVVGIEQAMKVICWYMGVEYEPPVKNATLF